MYFYVFYYFISRNTFNNYAHIKGKPHYIYEDDTVLFWISVQGNYSEIIIVGGFKSFKLINKTSPLKDDRTNKQQLHYNLHFIYQDNVFEWAAYVKKEQEWSYGK